MARTIRELQGREPFREILFWPFHFHNKSLSLGLGWCDIAGEEHAFSQKTKDDSSRGVEGVRGPLDTQPPPGFSRTLEERVELSGLLLKVQPLWKQLLWPRTVHDNSCGF